MIHGNYKGLKHRHNYLYNSIIFERYDEISLSDILDIADIENENLPSIIGAGLINPTISSTNYFSEGGNQLITIKFGLLQPRQQAKWRNFTLYSFVEYTCNTLYSPLGVSSMPFRYLS